MTVAHLIFTNGVAGAEKYLKNLLPAMKQHGINCHLIIICSPGYDVLFDRYCGELIDLGIPVKRLVSSKYGFLKTALRISDYLKEHTIRFIHSHMLKSDILASIIKIFIKRDVVIISTKHGYKESILKQDPSDKNIGALRKEAKSDIYYYVTRFVMANSDYNYAVSKAAALLYYNLGLTRTEMPYIHHGVNVVLPVNNEPSLYRFSLQQITTVGRLEEVKGHQFLLEAMKIVILKYPLCKALIIGEGTERVKMAEKIKQLGLQNNVELLGFKDDPYSYMINSDIVVLPSLFETFGLVYIEAFSIGTPVIAFNTTSSREIIQDNETGLLAETGNPIDLADKIIYLLDHPEIAAEIKNNARIKFGQSFTAKRMVDETAAFYKKVLTGHIS